MIGGAPAAAVVFPRDVIRRANADSRVIELEAEIESAPSSQKSSLRERLVVLKEEIMLEKRGEVAEEFDTIHSVQRAVDVGSLDGVLKPEALRPTIIRELEAAFQLDLT